MVSYSMDLRAKVLGAYDRGMTTNAIAEAFGVSTAWARRVRQRRRPLGFDAERLGSRHPLRRRQLLRSLRIFATRGLKPL